MSAGYPVHSARQLGDAYVKVTVSSAEFQAALERFTAAMRAIALSANSPELRVMAAAYLGEHDRARALTVVPFDWGTL